ncbi:MAG: 5-formyltetrahydrofolate cyclo-ligase [Promethearchaeota archaeon]
MGNSIDSDISKKKEYYRNKVRQLKVKIFDGHPEIYAEYNDKVFNHLIKLGIIENSNIFGCYASKSQSYEVSTDKFINYILSYNDYPRPSEVEARKRIFLPKCILEDRTLRFIEVRDLVADTQIGAFNVREPIIVTTVGSGNNLSEGTTNDHEFFLRHADVVIIPGLVFDRYGGRIGYGAGYFDRFINTIRGVNSKVKIIALAFSFQIFNERIPRAVHDALVDMIVTEKEILKIK